MPKLKTNSSAKKRFYVTGSGKIMRKRSRRRHLLRTKSKKQKRHLDNPAGVSKPDLNNVRGLLHI
ncbi:MAG: 50S ribosomal protein L35 [Bacteroidetes bacterium]|nr:50S ribosomal protein L35 [Bacteroidota bacterium]